MPTDIEIRQNADALCQILADASNEAKLGVHYDTLRVISRLASTWTAIERSQMLTCIIQNISGRLDS